MTSPTRPELYDEFLEGCRFSLLWLGDFGFLGIFGRLAVTRLSFYFGKPRPIFSEKSGSFASTKFLEGPVSFYAHLLVSCLIKFLRLCSFRRFPLSTNLSMGSDALGAPLERLLFLPLLALNTLSTTKVLSDPLNFCLLLKSRTPSLPA